MTDRTDLLSFFRAYRKDFENSVEWDEDDCNVDEIERRAEWLSEAALLSGNFDDMPATDIHDTAYGFVCTD